MTDDRPTAILTKNQREYLKGERDPAQERTMKTRIRDRVRQGILDFSLLFEHWPEEEREMVFSNIRDEELDEAIVDLLALVYLETRVADSFKNLLLRGVTKAERRAAGSDTIRVRTNFDPEITTEVNIREAIDKYKNREFDEMSDAEKTTALRTLQRAGTVSAKDLEESFETRQEQIQARVNEAKRNRAEYWREKQKRARDRSDE